MSENLFKQMNPPIELLKKCTKDDRKAHYELYNWCFKNLLNICRRYYKNQEDIKTSLNNIFLKIIKGLESAIGKYNDVPFELWAKRVAINHIIDEFRKNKNYREHIELVDEKDFLLSNFATVEENKIRDKENLEEINRAIETLPEMSKTVFNLFVVDGYKHEEIAEMLKISSNTSKVHLHRAKQKLQNILKATVNFILL